MGFFRKKKHDIMLKQDIAGYLVFPCRLKKDLVWLGAKAFVPENVQLAFGARGRILDILPSGEHILEPLILPKCNKKHKLQKLDKHGQPPVAFKGYAYFVNTDVVQNLVFSTYKKLHFASVVDGKFWAKMQFAVDVQIANSELFLKCLLREFAILRSNEPEEIFAMWLAEFVTDFLERGNLCRAHFEGGAFEQVMHALRAKLANLMQNMGIRLVGLRVLEVEKSKQKTLAKNPLLQQPDVAAAEQWQEPFEVDECAAYGEQEDVAAHEQHQGDQSDSAWTGWEQFLKK